MDEQELRAELQRRAKAKLHEYTAQLEREIDMMDIEQLRGLSDDFLKVLHNEKT